MEFFNEVIKYLPSYWQKETYNNKTYILVDLEEESEEYKEILEYCNTIGCLNNVKEIKRIQHPFAYLRFQLKLEFYRQWGEHISTIDRSITGIRNEDLDMYIKHNCDDRRRSCDFITENYVIKKTISVPPVRDTNWYPEYLVKMK